MAKNASSTTTIYQFLFGSILLAVFYSALKKMMFGSLRNAKMVAGLTIAIAVIFWLDVLYWLVLPLSAALTFTIPGLPFNSTEFGCISFLAVHFFRKGLHRDTPAPLNRDVLIAFPLFLWIAMVFVINPTGLHLYGSTSIGGRFYFQVFIGFFTMFCLSGLHVDEGQCKLLYRVIFFGILFSIGLALIHPSSLSLITDEGEFRLTNYKYLIFAPMFVLMMARYPLDQIFSSPRRLLVTGIAVVGTFVSGKRAVTAGLFFYPVFRAVITGRNKALTVLMIALASLGLMFLVTMDGEYITLPSSMKRSLAIVVPKYRNSVNTGLHDSFRQIIHRRAKAVVRKHPFLGERGFKMDLAEVQSILYRNSEGFEGYGTTKSWHGAFYAYAADFGIPCLLFYLVLLTHIARFSWKQGHCLEEGSFRSACFLFYSLRVWYTIPTMFTTGHSGITTFDLFLNYGMMLLLSNGITSERILANTQTGLATRENRGF